MAIERYEYLDIYWSISFEMIQRELGQTHLILRPDAFAAVFPMLRTVGRVRENSRAQRRVVGFSAHQNRGCTVDSSLRFVCVNTTPRPRRRPERSWATETAALQSRNKSTEKFTVGTSPELKPKWVSVLSSLVSASQERTNERINATNL